MCKKIDSVGAVETAKDGKDAIGQVDDWIKKGEKLPDVLFVDINMPVMDGFGFLSCFKERIQNNPILENIEVISMLTSSEEEENKKRAMATGIVKNYTVKPSGMEEMKDIILKFTV